MFDASELELIRASVRHVLESNSPADVPAALLAEGWADLINTDVGATITALGEEAGRTRSAAPVVDLAMMQAAGVAGDTTAAIIGGHVLAGAERAERFLCIADERIETVGADAVELVPASGFDPALGLSRATIVGPEREPVGGSDAAVAAVAAGRRVLASQMVGAADEMLAETLAYVIERYQYGRAIGSFQTVKHRLADVKVAVSAARATVGTAWEHADDLQGPTLAIAAKALAGRAQQLASTHCFQVHGGIAFTVEHGFHQWVRRGLLLDHLLGGHDQLTRDLGRSLLAAHRLPRLPNLDDRPRH